MAELPPRVSHIAVKLLPATAQQIALSSPHVQVVSGLAVMAWPKQLRKQVLVDSSHTGVANSTIACTPGCRVCPGRFSATYLLLLGVQRGTEAQAAAVDWILARDWPQGAGGEGGDASGPIDLTGSSPKHSGNSTGDSSSLDTQQVLGGAAAEAMRLADTASSRAKQTKSYQAARVRQRAVLQRAAAAGQQQVALPLLGLTSGRKC
jgi:hypothetical protein